MTQRRFPPYPKKPHPSGQVRIRLAGHDCYLGLHGSKESWAEYQRLLVEWRASAASTTDNSPQVTSAPVRTVADLAARYLDHYARTYPQRAGELRNLRDSFKPLLRQHGHHALVDVGPTEILDLLPIAAAGGWLTDEERAARSRCGNPTDWCRSYTNRALARWKRAWRWAELRRLIPQGSYAALVAVKGLEEGQARETANVPPVAEAHYRATLPHLNVVARAAVELLELTGARPGEILRLTPGDLDRSGEVEVAKHVRVQLGAGCWAFQPLKHKTSWRGHRRVILFGPRAQVILAPLLVDRKADAPLFSAAEGREARYAVLRARRQTPVQPSQRCRRKPDPARPPGARYGVAALRRAITYACKRAAVPNWHPNQLRHLAASRLVSEFGPDVARSVLGHKDFRMLGIYALADVKKAADVMREVG